MNIIRREKPTLENINVIELKTLQRMLNGVEDVLKNRVSKTTKRSPRESYLAAQAMLINESILIRVRILVRLSIITDIKIATCEVDLGHNDDFIARKVELLDRLAKDTLRLSSRIDLGMS